MLRLFLMIISFTLIDTTIFGGSALEYEIIGNVNTKDSYIRYLIKSCTDKNEELRQCLLNSRLFSEVQVSKKENKIQIKVEERWTIIPIPFYSRDSAGNRRYGFFLMETNLFGYGNVLLLGSTVSAGGSEFFTMFQDKAVAFSDWTLGFSAGHGTKDIWVYNGEHKKDGFKERQSFLMVAVGRNLTPWLNLSLNLSGARKDFLELDGFEKRHGYQTGAIGPSLRWEDTAYRFFFLEGWSIRANLSSQINRNDGNSTVKNIDMSLSFEKALVSNQALQLQTNLGSTTAAREEDYFRRGGGRGFRGIPSNGLWTKKYTAFAVDYQVPLLTATYGTYTIAPFGDYADTERWLPGKGLHYAGIRSYGLGTYLFLKRVAIPGVGLQFGQCSDYSPFFATFSLGMSIQ